MRADRRPYWVKKVYLMFREWYADHFLRPSCDYLGDYHTIMRPWYVDISGPNIRIGKCATIIGEKTNNVKIGVWGQDAESGSITIGDYALLSPGVRINACDEIVLGDSVMMAAGSYITDSDWHEMYDRGNRATAVNPVYIGDNVWIGDHAMVLKGVTIGENSVVAAGAVVVKDVPANVVVAGNPAKIVKELDTEREMKTRAATFQEPEKLALFFDGVDREVLKNNTTLNWLRTLVCPNKLD